MHAQSKYNFYPIDINIAYDGKSFPNLPILEIGDTLLYDTDINIKFNLQTLLDFLEKNYNYDVYLKSYNGSWFAIRVIGHK